MRAHYFQHVPFEGLGSIEPWLQSTQAEVTRTRFFEDPTIPDVNHIDLLIIMGGPMSVNDESDFPWLIAEKRFIREAIASNKAVVGICLGAQLIASALGAAVYPNQEKEIGWFPISGTSANDPRACFSFPEELLVFHWHGETFDLPYGATRLAGSIACENQAFQLGPRIIGLQFHLETTPRSVRDIVANCRAELEPSRYVQSETQMLPSDASTYHDINFWMEEVLKYVTAP